MNLIINTDGASRGNPGKAAYGFVIKNKEGIILHQEGKCIGVATNNVAEYTAVLKSFEYIKEKLNKPLSAASNGVSGSKSRFFLNHSSSKQVSRYSGSANKKPLHKIRTFSDSELIVNQLGGKYKIKNLTLKELALKIIDLTIELGEVEFIAIPREENYIADRLANLALDRQT